MATLYIYNPEHDLALANGSANFVAPESVRTLAYDLSVLPLWIARDGYVLSEMDISDWHPLPQAAKVISLSNLSAINCDKILPWGWDLALTTELTLAGIPKSLLMSPNQIESFRQMSHRRSASALMSFLQEKLPDITFCSSPAVELKSINEVRTFAEKYPKTVLKAPWSCSGKGTFWNSGAIIPSLEGWCKRVIDKQGAVMGEPAYRKLQDFAMEFHSNGLGTIKFVGYSLFHTEDQSGIYRGNRLMSDSDIEIELCKWISKETLYKVREQTMAFLSTRFANAYEGYIGVDMLIFEENDKYFINPAVEINVRMTMGLIAHIFYKKYVAEGTKGWLQIDHMPPTQLLKDHEERQISNPLLYDEGKILRGYLSLCPISKTTLYRIRVEID